MSAQVTATAPPLSNDLANYNNRWDAYGGFGYARFQTTLGVNLKTNMYGWKGQVTGWLNPIVGITAAHRQLLRHCVATPQRVRPETGEYL